IHSAGTLIASPFAIMITSAQPPGTPPIATKPRFLVWVIFPYMVPRGLLRSKRPSNGFEITTGLFINFGLISYQISQFILRFSILTLKFFPHTFINCQHTIPTGVHRWVPFTHSYPKNTRSDLGNKDALITERIVNCLPELGFR